MNVFFVLTYRWCDIIEQGDLTDRESILVLGQLRETCSYFHAIISPTWKIVCELQAEFYHKWVKSVARDVNAKLNLLPKINRKEIKIEIIEDILATIIKNKKWWICQRRHSNFSNALFIQFKQLKFVNGACLDSQYKLLFPNSPELTEDLEWKFEFA